MMNTLATLALVLSTTASGANRTDTTITVRQGARLEVSNFAGAISVKTWAKNAIRIAADHSSRVYVEIDDTPSLVSVRGRSTRGVPSQVDYELTVPTWIGLDLSGVATDIDVDGVKGEIKAETVRGDINVKGGGNYVSLGSVEGEVAVSGARGRIELSSVNQGIQGLDLSGDVEAETVNGDIDLRSVISKNLRASTVNGAILYLGSLESEGVYEMSTHNGDIIVGVPDKANVAVSVATFGGEFGSTFPVTITKSRKKRFAFTLGTGSARLDLESFQGTIRLARPSEVLQQAASEKKGKEKEYKYKYHYRAQDNSEQEDHDHDENENGEP